MIRLLLLAPTNTISLPLEKANALPKITKFLMFPLVVFISNLVVLEGYIYHLNYISFKIEAPLFLWAVCTGYYK